MAVLGALLSCMAIHMEQPNILNMSPAWIVTAVSALSMDVRFWLVACDSIYPRVEYIYGCPGR
jgi:hypothetical protein